MHHKAFLVAVLLAGTVGSVACGGEAAVLPGESRTTAARLVEVRSKIAGKKYTEAINELQKILDTAGNDLAPLTPQHCVQARRLCQRELSRLPPEALHDYRARVDPQAKKWLDEAMPARDVRLLRRIVDEAFCSHAGEKAVDLLGDLAFEDGRFDEAIMWWRLLAPPLGAKNEKRDDLALVYPDVQGDRAKLYAKQIVARFFAGATDEAKRAWKTFQATFPNAVGTLTGRQGKYADLLRDILKETPPEVERTWTTFGGDGTRGLVLSAPPRCLERLSQTVKDGPTWRFNLETRSRYEESPPPGFGKGDSVRAASLAFQPLIHGHYVIVSDARYVTAYDVNTGKAAIWFDVKDLKSLADPNLKLPAPADLRYTLTADNDCLYVRLGAQSIFSPDEPDLKDADFARKEREKDRKIASFLVCLNLDPAQKDRRIRWCMRPVVRPGKPEWAQSNAMFEGTPVIHNGLLYIAVTWFEGDRTLTAIQCYPASTENAPSVRWQQTVCETHELKAKEARLRHQLLTIAGPNVVYCSHSGAIVAVDAVTGKTAWAVRYLSKTPTNADEPALRDLTPCVYAAGRLYAAPTDQTRLLCLDPLTGETLWVRDRIAVTHLLGVGKGRLIYTTLAGLHAVNVADGGDAGGWFLPDGGGKMAPMGRGFLIGDVVVWPAVAHDGDHVFVRREEDGAPTDFIAELQRVPAGNLAYGNGVLAVADRTTLSIFVPQELAPSNKLEQTKKAAPLPLQESIEQALADPVVKVQSSLTFPLQRSSALTLNEGEHVLSVGEDDLLSGRADGTLRLLSATTGEQRWTSMVSFAPRWTKRAGNLVLVGGTGGVAALQWADGRCAWEVGAQELMPTGDQSFAGFQYAAGRLFFIQGEDRLHALDAGSGRVLWSQWAIGARLKLPPPHGRFHPTLLVTPTTVLVQPTPGRIWLVDAATGKRLHEESQRFEPWPRPPIAVDEKTAAIVLDARTVALFDLTIGKPLWKHVSNEATTLSGAAPQLIADQENILLLTAHNVGSTLQRLDPATGKVLWQRPPFLEAKSPLDTAGWSLDRNAIYSIQDGVLTAQALADGKLLWQQALDGADGNWRTRRAGDTVLAYLMTRAARQIHLRWLWFSVQLTVDRSRQASADCGLPVICCAAKTGRIIQRLNLPLGPPPVPIRLGVQSRFVAQPHLQTWTVDVSPQFALSRTELLIALDSKVWKYNPAP